MHSKSLLLMAVLMATATAMLGQNIVEYSRLPMAPPKLPSPASTLASHVGNDKSAPKGPSIIEVPGSVKNTAQPASPPPTAVFILSNGDRVESTDYSVTSNSVRLVDKGVRRTIPISALNVQATEAANKQRGIELNVPTDNSQMVLAF